MGYHYLIASVAAAAATALTFLRPTVSAFHQQLPPRSTRPFRAHSLLPISSSSSPRTCLTSTPQPKSLLPSPTRSSRTCARQLHSSSTSSSSSGDAVTAINYFKSTPIEELLPSTDLLLIIDEILESKSLIDDTEALVVKNIDSIERRLRDEGRSIKELIGEEGTSRILKSVGNIDGYDDAAVKAFLGSDAVNNLFTRILYDGIYEFFNTIDVFGRVISNLPIIGPIRNQIRDETKKNLDRTLGPLVKGFLREYTKVAVGEATGFVLSPANRKVFGQANQRLVSSILDRPLNTLLPPGDMTEKLVDDAFEYVRHVRVEELKEYVEFVYGYVGDKSVDRVVDVDRVLEASPTLKKTIDNVWAKATSGDGS